MRVDRNTASGIECVTNSAVLPVFVPQPQQLLIEHVAHDLVERAERLVHQQQVGIERQRARDRGALLHAARQLPGKLVAEAGEVDEFEPALDARLALGLADSP